MKAKTRPATDPAGCDCPRCRFNAASARIILAATDFSAVRGTLMLTAADEGRAKACREGVNELSRRVMRTTPPGDPPTAAHLKELERLAAEYERVVADAGKRADDPANKGERERRNKKHNELSFASRELAVRVDRATAAQDELTDAQADLIHFHNKRMEAFCELLDESPVWSDAVYDEGMARIAAFTAALVGIGR